MSVLNGPYDTKKQQIIENNKQHDGDTGSPEVQGAILTKRINDLTEHLKIHKKGELTIQSLLYRAILINGLGYVTVSLLLLWILPSFSYFFTISSICILQVILVIVSFFMILYNKDGKSLEDLLTDTEVIHVEEVK